MQPKKPYQNKTDKEIESTYLFIIKKVINLQPVYNFFRNIIKKLKTKKHARKEKWNRNKK